MAIEEEREKEQMVRVAKGTRSTCAETKAITKATAHRHGHTDTDTDTYTDTDTHALTNSLPHSGNGSWPVNMLRIVSPSEYTSDAAEL